MLKSLLEKFEIRITAQELNPKLAKLNLTEKRSEENISSLLFP